MMQSASKPVLIVLPDGYADRETPLISGFGGDFYGLQVSHANPDGGARSMGGPHVTDLAGDADASDYRDRPRPPGVPADAPLASAAHPI